MNLELFDFIEHSLKKQFRRYLGVIRLTISVWVCLKYWSPEINHLELITRSLDIIMYKSDGDGILLNKNDDL